LGLVTGLIGMISLESHKTGLAGFCFPLLVM
jgi:hypothetical protein